MTETGTTLGLRNIFLKTSKKPHIPHHAGNWNRQAQFKKLEDIVSDKNQGPETAGRFRSNSDNRAIVPCLTFYAYSTRSMCKHMSHAFTMHVYAHRCLTMKTHAAAYQPTSLKHVANISPIRGTSSLHSCERHVWKYCLLQFLQID